MQTKSLVDVELVAEGLKFPEGPVVLPDGSVLVTEILSGCLVRVGLDGTKTVAADVGGGPNGAAIGPDGALYVCNNGGIGAGPRGLPGVQRVDLRTGESAYLYTESGGRPLVAPNDIVFDTAGHFYFTDLRGDAIHYASIDGSSIKPVVTRIPRPNGVGLSPAGDVLYWAQTESRQVMRRRITGPGVIVASAGCSVNAVFAGLEPDRWSLVVGLPGCQEFDSLAVDSGGSVCVGTLIDGGITEVSPDGGLDAVVRWQLPDSLYDAMVTNIAFGGPDLTTAYLTCSAKGRLVRCTWPRPGLRLAY